MSKYNSHLESPWRNTSVTEIISNNKDKNVFLLCDSLMAGFGSGDLVPKGKVNMDDIGNFIFRNILN